jgi:hypothetical protein
MVHRDGLRPRLLGRFAGFLFLLPLLVLASMMSAFAQGPVPAPGPPAASPSKEILEGWHRGMARVPPPNQGCFTSSYPNTQWQEVPCVPGPTVPFPPARIPPARGPEPSTVGNGNDVATGVTTGHISTSVGSFDSVSGVTSVTSEFGADDYSLQLNTNTFSSPICSGAEMPSQCVGWQQFIFSNLQCSGPCTFMQYWLIGWGKTTCPTGWMFFLNGTDDECYMSSSAVVPPQQTIANLGNLSVVAEAISGGMDAVIFSSDTNLYTVQVNDNALSLAEGWTAVEYNIVGDCCGSAATFNSGSSIVVRVSVDNGSPSAPSCLTSFSGYTAETNNLYFQPSSGTPRSSTEPAIVFTQSSTVTSTLPCQSGVAVAAASKLADTRDFNGDGFSDILWHDTSGDVAIWLMNGTSVLNPNTAGVGNVPTAWSIVGAGDFNGDGFSDILWRDTSGDVAIWLMNGTQILNPNTAGVGNVATTWSIVGTGDFNGDGKRDVLWRDTSGNVAIWLMNGTQVLNPNTAGVGNVATTWSIVGTGDFNGDGNWDILWRDTSGNVAIWEMNGTTVLNPNTAGVGNVATTWSIVGTGDFNADGKSDILWHDTGGNVAIWEMNGTTVLNPNTAGVGNVTTSFKIVGSGDFNGDGKSDVLWRDTSGNIAIWEMNGTTVLNPNTAGVGNVPIIWTVQDPLGG